MAGIRLQLDPTAMVAGAAQAKSAIESLAAEAISTESRLLAMGEKGKELNKIKLGLDPVYAAALRAGASVKDLDTLLGAGGISAAQYAAKMASIKGSLDKVANSSASASGVMGRFGPKMQQIGLQAGDMAVQVGAGTSATQALGQQLPQLLGAFGPLGAVMGAVAAIAIPLGAALLNLGGETISLTEALDEADDAITSFRSAMESAYAPTADLLREFGSASPTLRAALIELAGIEKIKAFEALDQTAASMVALVGYAGQWNAEANKITQSFLGLVVNSEASRVAAFNFHSALMQLSNAQEPVEKLRAALDLRSQLDAATGGYANMNSEQREVREGLTRIIVQMEAMGVYADGAAAAMAQVGINAAGAEGQVSALAAQARALSDAAWSAANGMLLYGQRQSEAAADAVFGPRVAPKVPSGLGNYMGQPVDFSALPDDRGEAIRDNRAGVQDARSTRIARTQEVWLDEYGKPPKGGGGGGGGGENEAEKAARAYDSLLGSLDPVIRADQDFAEAQKTVNAALDAGYISAEQAASTIALARDEMDKAKASAEGAAGAWQDMWSAGGSAIDALIAGTGKLSDVLKQALVDMVALLTKRALLGSVAGGLATDSVGTLIAKSMFGGFFDTGGAMAIGSVGIVGERGPELVASTSRGAVVTSRTDTAAMRGGGQVEVIGGDLQLSDSGQIFARMQVVARQAAFAAGQAAINETRRNLGGWNQQLNTDGALV